MVRARNFIPLVVALALAMLASPGLAATTNDFDGGGTPWAEDHSNGSYVPGIQAGGPTGNFLRLLYDTGSLRNTVAFDQTDAGGQLSTATFEFRLPPESTHTGCCGQRADGFSLSVVGAGTYGTSGALPVTTAVWERPQFADSFAVGFDIFEGDPGNPATLNNVYTINANGSELVAKAIHEGQFRLTSPDATAPAGQWNRAKLSVASVGPTGPSLVSLEITPDIHGTPGAPVKVFDNQVIAAATGVGARLAFGGRTGGAYTSVDLDNVQATFAAPGAALGPLPAGWTSQDINTSGGMAGTTSTGAIVVVGDGSDIWGNSDQFHYASQTAKTSGDFTASARLLFQENTNGWAKAGVMAREDMTAGSRHVNTSATPSNGVTQQWRDNTGGGSGWPGARIPGSPNSDQAPIWMKLERKGSLYLSSYAADNNGQPMRWSQPDIHPSPLTGDVHLGLSATSHSSGTVGVNAFDNVDMASAPPGVPAPKLIGPYGPNGTWVAYERAPSVPFDTARAYAAAKELALAEPAGTSVAGHLVTVNSGAENEFLHRRLGPGWIGLTDLESVSSIDGFDYSTLGTSEGGNTSGDPIPVGTAPGSGQRGRGYRWVNGEPFHRSFWNGGEPNDSGGEDAIEMISGDTDSGAVGRYGGRWNDLPAGSTAGQRDGSSRESTIEYNLGAPTRESISVPGFLVSVYKATDGGIGVDPWGLRDADALIGSTGDPGRIIGTAPVTVTDFHNTGGAGNFGTNLPFPGTTVDTTVDNAVLEVTGTITVPTAARYQFRLTGDDGGRLRINGMDVIHDDDMHGVENADSQTVWLPAGTHKLEWINMEGGGGWTGELAYDNLDQAGGWIPVGDTSQGLAANLTATTYKLSGNVDIGNLAQAEQLIAGQLHRGEGTPVHGIASVIDFGDGGRYPYNDSFLGVTGDDLVLEATTMVQIPAAGKYTFAFQTDDGGALQITGADLVSVTNDIGSTLGVDGILAYDGLRGMGADTLGVFDFPAAGLYDLRFVMFERGGGEGAELFAAPGAHTSFGTQFALVGDLGAGGLGVVTSVPEPATMALLGLAACGLGGYLRRRRKA